MMFENGVFVTGNNETGAATTMPAKAGSCGCKSKMHKTETMPKLERTLLILQVVVGVLSILVLMKTYNKLTA